MDRDETLSILIMKEIFVRLISEATLSTMFWLWRIIFSIGLFFDKQLIVNSAKKFDLLIIFINTLEALIKMIYLTIN